ncbi:MAG: hypothetical protein ACK4YO_03880, partial [Candidatus Altarchaeaceae archaeon]
FNLIEGSASVCVLFDDNPYVLLATNTGSLYMCEGGDGNEIIFASEKYILSTILQDKEWSKFFNTEKISKILPGTGYLINTKNINKNLISLNNSDKSDENLNEEKFSKNLDIIDLSLYQGEVLRNIEKYKIRPELKEEMLRNWEKIYSDETDIKRCTKCLLPSTMPFIEFDEDGVCNYCRDYERRKPTVKGEKVLKEIVEKYRSKEGNIDCVVGFSGGRDSSYGLHYITNHLGLHPVVFIYDWGMVTDLARRNQARVCGKLGIEQIIISAD